MPIVIMYVAYFIIMICVIVNKNNYHVDEIYSYGLANHQGDIHISFTEGITYEPSDQPWLEYMNVNKEHRFDYKNVWKNQGNDVHPPFYYLLLHTVCSLFPNSFSKWYAASINIVFALLTLYILRKLVRILTSEELACNVASFVYVLSAGILSEISFFRMYIVAMFWVTLLVYEFELVADKKNEGKLFWIKLYIIAVLAALTHYYCIIFTVFLCATYCIFKLFSRQYATIGKMIIVGVLCAITSYMIFPSMINHMFFGYRGSAVIENLGLSFKDTLTRFVDFYHIINKAIFGNILSYIFVVLILYLILDFAGKSDKYRVWENIKIALNDNRVIKASLIIVPSVLYFLMVAKMTVYITERYMAPIYAICIALFVSLLYSFLGTIVKNKREILFLLVIVVSIVVVNGLRAAEWTYLYKSSNKLLESSKKYADVDCVYIYEEKYRAQPSFLEVKNYKSVTFVNQDNHDLLDEISNTSHNSLIVCLPKDKQELLKEVQELYPSLTKAKELGKYGYSITYYLCSE